MNDTKDILTMVDHLIASKNRLLEQNERLIMRVEELQEELSKLHKIVGLNQLLKDVQAQAAEAWASQENQ